MAAEIKITANIQFAKGNIATMARTASNVSVDVAGDACIANVQTVGTSEEALLVGDVAAAGYGWFKNLDATNFVSLRPGTGTANCIKLMPGEVALFRASVALWAIADTAPVQLEYFIIEP